MATLPEKTAAQKRQEQLEVKPKLGTVLKVCVAGQAIKRRPFYQEVAEVFEEMLTVVENLNGRTKAIKYLPPRLNRAPGKIENEIKVERKDKFQEELEYQ